MNNGSNIPEVEPGIPPQSPNNAVSVYGQNDAMDDFPVLKAFQQYVDAEQAKAQKRMTTLCVFFSIILAIVVGVFVMLIMSMSNAKNDANEKLIQLMMQDRERHQNVVVQTPQPPAQSEAAIKALTDTVTSLQKQLADQQIKMIEEKQKAAEEAVKRAQEAAAEAAKPKPPSAEQLANQSEADKLAKAAANLKKQREELAQEKEKLRQREIEFNRRRLYPEYYEKQRVIEPPAVAQPPVGTATRKYPDPLDDEDDDEQSLDEMLGTTDVARPSPSPKKPAVSPSAKPQPVVTKPIKLDDGSLRYFDDEEYAADEKPPAAKTRPAVVPVRPIDKKPAKPAKPASAATAHDALLKGNGATAGWSLPLE